LPINPHFAYYFWTSFCPWLVKCLINFNNNYFILEYILNVLDYSFKNNRISSLYMLYFFDKSLFDVVIISKNKYKMSNSVTPLHIIKHWISNSCTWPSALLGRLFPSPNWPLWKFYPPKFPATLVLKTMTARRSPLYFRTIGGQENHVQGALLIESGVVRELSFLFHIEILA
jgi:hypothetical protein